MAHLHFVDYPSKKKVLLFFFYYFFFIYLNKKKFLKKGVMDVGRSFDFFFPFFNIMYCVCVCVSV